ncbi:hypothetical protein GQ600_23501 [Phytophthora cactorum]|nr:hypothetical protein GQ600_23501 [Phytophthora cactorum]
MKLSGTVSENRVAVIKCLVISETCHDVHKIGNTADGDKNNTERGINLDAIPVLTKLTVNIPIVDKTRLQLWLTFRTSADDVFKKMKLTSVEGNLLADPRSCFGLSACDWVTDSTIGGLEASEHSTLDVFEALQFKKHDILMNPALTSWFKYLDDFNVRNPTEKLSLMETLSLGLGDRALAEVLEAGMNAGRTKEISTKLKNQLFAEWETKKFSPTHIWCCGLKNITGMQQDRFFRIRYELLCPENYADEALIEMLVAAKKDPTAETIAKNLELLLLTRWLREKKQPPTVARWMFADKSGEMLDTYTRFFKAKWPNDA